MSSRHCQRAIVPMGGSISGLGYLELDDDLPRLQIEHLNSGGPDLFDSVVEGGYQRPVKAVPSDPGIYRKQAQRIAVDRRGCEAGDPHIARREAEVVPTTSASATTRAPTKRSRQLLHFAV